MSTTAPATAPEGIRRALVVGLGASGTAAARALHAAGVEVVMVDDRSDHPAAAELTAAGIDVALGVTPLDRLDDVDLVVPSPGVPERAPVLQAAAERDLPVWSEPELGHRLHPRRLLAVTGTNGKTSVTELLATMLQAGGLDAVACGNIGRPFTEAAAVAAADAVLVAELSSFQLRFAHRLRPEVGVLLNLAADHLDWHPDLAAYGEAKARLWQAQQAGDWAVTNQADAVTVDLGDRFAPAGRAAFDGDALVAGVGVGVADGHLMAATPIFTGRLLPVADLALDAPHHRANVAAAATAALLAGVAPATVAEVARTFHPGAHRLELVAEIDGVRYVDDSKATNVHAAAAALRSAPSIVWVAGGLAKGVDLSALAGDLGAVRAAVLIGTAAPELAEVCASVGVRSQHAETIESAVEAASRAARAGDTVLLAPACASFDQFSGYAERGERFAAAVRALRSPTPGVPMSGDRS
ncbi:MAG: UDP-N-acetylmuramoyl-L-alanine--D-glutamate ligase [Actinobacteria bacterium]|jgi:UDP-N-acetylmuramoylalanine--D-glutamate ligase|nr:UDP-N-acetylmuramoyl-L-alanine--D-glutamate ligase [Actinomycetota bacterium]